MHIGKAPFRGIQLVGRNPQIEQDPVHLGDPQLVQDPVQVPEVVVDNLHLAPGVLQPLRSRGNGVLILVNADQQPFRVQQFRDPVRMAPTPQGAVHIDPLEIRNHPLYTFFQ